MFVNRMNRINRLKMLGILHCNDDGGDGGSGGGDGVTVEDLQSQLADLSKSNDSLKAKNEELLGETKKAKTAKREAEAQATAEAEAKAKEAGDHEQLYKSSQSKLSSTLEELEGLRGSIATEKRNTEALKMATELADNIAGGAQNATILSRDIAQRLKFTDEGLKVTDASGQLTVSSLDDLKAEFKNNSMYSGLLKGNQSSGGGANGGNNSGGAAKTISFGEFNKLDPGPRMEFIQKGGKVIDD